MEVTLIGSTVINLEAVEKFMEVEPGTADMDVLPEFGGRACYQSWDKPNPKTRSNRDYLRSVIGKQHTSVLVHSSATFYVTGVSRALTHELIRHRWLGFSELSQRFVDMDESLPVLPPAIENMGGLMDIIENHYEMSVYNYNTLVEALIEKGKTRKQAREAARCVMPNSSETRIVVSGNIRAWRDFIAQRESPQADAEIREFALEVRRQLEEIAPASMQLLFKE